MNVSNLIVMFIVFLSFFPTKWIVKQCKKEIRKQLKNLNISIIKINGFIGRVLPKYQWIFSVSPPSQSIESHAIYISFFHWIRSCNRTLTMKYIAVSFFFFFTEFRACLTFPAVERARGSIKRLRKQKQKVEGKKSQLIILFFNERNIIFLDFFFRFHSAFNSCLHFWFSLFASCFLNYFSVKERSVIQNANNFETRIVFLLYKNKEKIG